MGEGSKRGGDVYAIKPGQNRTSVEGEGPSRGVTEPVCIQMGGESGREERSGGRVS